MNEKLRPYTTPCVPLDGPLSEQALALWNRLAGGVEIPHRTLDAVRVDTLFLADANGVSRERRCFRVSWA